MILNNLNVRFYHNKEQRTTQCAVSSSDTLISSATTKCGPNDVFCKIVGRKQALSKAIQHLPRETRTGIWNDYKAQVHIV